MFSFLASFLAALLSLLGGFAPPIHGTPPSQASVMVQPETVALHPGKTQQLTVVATDRRGRPANARKVRWSSSAASVATVSSAGLIGAVAPGTATITASFQGATDSSVVTVTPAAPANQPPTVTITAPTGGATFDTGETISFDATANDPEDGSLTSTIAWSVGETPLGAGGEVTTSSLAPGSHTVTASVTDTDGATTSDSVTVTVTAPPPNQVPTVSITGPSDGADVYSSQTFDVTATATDPEDGDITANVEWSIVSANGTTPAGTGDSITVGPLTIGTYTVIASVTDAGGLTGADQITVDVVQEPVVVTVASDDTSFNESEVIGFTATVTGAVSGVAYNELADSASWTLASADGTPQDAGTGGSIDVGPLTPGSYTITATVDPGGDQSPASGQATIPVGDCTVTASLRPATGLYIPQLLALSATKSTDSCDRPLRYYWGCESDTISYCADFVAAANADGNTHPMTAIQINTFDEIAILLTVCAVDPTYDPASSAPSGDCAPQLVNVYRGAVT